MGDRISWPQLVAWWNEIAQRYDLGRLLAHSELADQQLQRFQKIEGKIQGFRDLVEYQISRRDDYFKKIRFPNFHQLLVTKNYERLVAGCYARPKAPTNWGEAWNRRNEASERPDPNAMTREQLQEALQKLRDENYDYSIFSHPGGKKDVPF